MSWLLPEIILPPAAKVHTVGELGPVALDKARQKRYRLGATYRARQERTRLRRNARARDRYRNEPVFRADQARRVREYRTSHPAFREHQAMKKRVARAAKRTA